MHSFRPAYCNQRLASYLASPRPLRQSNVDWQPLTACVVILIIQCVGRLEGTEQRGRRAMVVRTALAKRATMDDKLGWDWKVQRVAVSKEDPVPDALDPDKTKESISRY